MNRFLRIIGGLVILSALAALVISVALTSRGPQPATTPEATTGQGPHTIVAQRRSPTAAPATPISQKPTIVPTSAATPQQGQTPPAPIAACTFATPVGPEPQAQPLPTYTFSEPAVVLSGRTIGIASWLPDSQRVLITRADPALRKQAIEMLDVTRGSIERLALRIGFGAKPIWLTSEQAVAFADADANKQTILRIGRGPRGQLLQVEDVAQDLSTPYLSASPDGRQLVFASRLELQRPQVVNTNREPRQVRPLTQPLIAQNSVQPGATMPQQGRRSEPFRSAWSPAGDQIALYTMTGFYLTRISTGQTCLVDLGKEGEETLWASHAQWSPDGRFLAILVTAGEGLPFPFQYIVLLDTSTGVQRRVDLGTPFVFEVAWGPRSPHLLALGRVGRNASGSALLGLHLIDTRTGTFTRVLPSHTFTAGSYTYEGGGLAWSPDGKNVLVTCPAPTTTTQPEQAEDPVCLITLTTQP